MNTPNMFARTQTQAVSMDLGLRKFLLGVYNYMASALALTGIVAMFAGQSEAFMSSLYSVSESGKAMMSPVGWVVMLAPLGMVLWLSFGINRMKAGTAQILFWAYAVLMGLSLSSIFMVFTGASIAKAFFSTAAVFGGMSLYGYTTKRDLTGMGSFLFMGLIGVIIASLVNIFLKSSGLEFALSILTLGIFVGLTAYDTQKLKGIYYQVAGSAEMAMKASIMGALSLYIDFINIFLTLLRFFGERR